MAKALDLREQMPFTASVIAALRPVFGAREINEVVLRSMNGAQGFYARENGIEVGTPFTPARVEVSGEQMVIISPKEDGK